MSGREKTFLYNTGRKKQENMGLRNRNHAGARGNSALVPQYPGDTNRVIVEEGSYVVAGQRIADSMEAMPLHSAVSGTVEESCRGKSQRQ